MKAARRFGILLVSRAVVRGMMRAVTGVHLHGRTPMRKAALYTAGAIFAAVAAGHLARLIAGFEIVVGGIVVPVRMSFLGALIAGVLAVWMAVAAQRS